MQSLEALVKEQLQNGLHCSQVMMQLSLDMRGLDHPFAVRALGALGGGMCAQRTCGTLTGAVAAIGTYFPRGATQPEPAGYQAPARELVAWFTQEYGSLECRELLAGAPSGMAGFCPKLMVATFEKMLDILEAQGVGLYG